MEDVDFAYEEEKWIYRNADFRAEPGEIVALIRPFRAGEDHHAESDPGTVSSSERQDHSGKSGRK